MGRIALAIVATFLALLAFGAGGCFELDAEPEAAEPAAPAAAAAATARPPVAERTDLTADERSTIELFRRSSPSVVFITSVAVRRDVFSMNLFEIPGGTGTGFLWDRQGRVVTNYHVIRGSDRAQVTLADRSTWPARVVGAAPEKDLAVLEIEADPSALEPIPLGRSNDLAVGQKVLAIGNPFGLDQTLTTGIISALGREIDSLAGIPIRDVIQTDAAINPGNSGGPLLDSSGRLVGVNTAIYSPSGAYAGIGFAIPVDTVAWVVPELIAHGRLVRPTLGVELAPDQIARDLDLPGVLLVRVHRDGPAARAGLRPTTRDRQGRVELGDVLVSIDGSPVASGADLFLLLERFEVGDEVTLGIVRADRPLEVPVTLGPPSAPDRRTGRARR